MYIYNPSHIHSIPFTLYHIIITRPTAHHSRPAQLSPAQSRLDESTKKIKPHYSSSKPSPYQTRGSGRREWGRNCYCYPPDRPDRHTTRGTPPAARTTHRPWWRAGWAWTSRCGGCSRFRGVGRRCRLWWRYRRRRRWILACRGLGGM